MRNITLICVLVFLASCHREPSPEPPEPQQSIPLSVGSWWIYRDVADTTKFDTTTVLDDTIYNGHNAYKILGYLMGTKDTTIVYYADSNLNMAYNFAIDPIYMTIEGILMPEFLTTGQHWKVGEDSVSGIDFPPFFDTTDVIILSIWGRTEDSVMLSLPAGDFNPSFLIHYEDSIFKNSRDTLITTITTYSWVCPGNGIVARDENGDSVSSPTAELWDYHLSE
ncbi:MAG: hypothetical protein ACP5QG_00570 [candidate division WOR-3 bacterium]